MPLTQAGAPRQLSALTARNGSSRGRTAPITCSTAGAGAAWRSANSASNFLDLRTWAPAKRISSECLGLAPPEQLLDVRQLQLDIGRPAVVALAGVGGHFHLAQE